MLIDLIMADNSVSTFVAESFGPDTRCTEMTTMGDLDLRVGVPHSTTGLVYSLSGRAMVINKKIAAGLAGFEDPIKAIMPVAVHDTHKVVVRRKYVVGSQAVITPERAPAKTVSVREDEREVLLTRYGGDLEMNLNLFHRPTEASEELEMKLGAQRGELENKLVELGYEAVMSQGTPLTTALMRASPQSSHLSEVERSHQAQHIYVSSVFGTIGKNSYPIENLLAAAARGSVYHPSSVRREAPVMIVPSGLIEMSTYTEPTTMKFSVSGLKAVEHGAISIPLSGAVVDPRTNVRLMIHVPVPTTELGGVSQATMSGLCKQTAWGTYYEIPGINLDTANFGKDNSGTKHDEFRITDFKGRTWKKFEKDALKAKVDAAFTAAGVEENDKDNVTAILVRPRMVAHMQSAILATAPSSRSGELLMAYPQTNISTNQSIEVMKMQLRVYLGAAVYDPDRYIIMDNVAFNGLMCGHGTHVYEGGQYDHDSDDLIVGIVKKDTNLTDWRDDEYFVNSVLNRIDPSCMPLGKNDPLPFHDVPDACCSSLFPGRVQIVDTTGGYKDLHVNCGHLGSLDDPDCVDRLEGIQKYTPRHA